MKKFYARLLSIVILVGVVAICSRCCADPYHYGTIPWKIFTASVIGEFALVSIGIVTALLNITRYLWAIK